MRFPFSPFPVFKKYSQDNLKFWVFSAYEAKKYLYLLFLILDNTGDATSKNSNKQENIKPKKTVAQKPWKT